MGDVDNNGNNEQVALSVSSGTLSLNGITGLSLVSGAFNSASMVFTGSLANIDQALAGLTYHAPTSAGTSTLGIAIDDLGNSGSPGFNSPLTTTSSVQINVTPVAPVVTLSSSTPSYTAGSSPAAAAVAVDSGLTVSDAGDPYLASATVSIGSGFASGQDSLAATPPSDITAVYNPATGVLTLTANTNTVSVADFKAALDSVTYQNTSNNASVGTRAISIVTSDGVTSSTPVTKTVTVTRVDQAPTIGTILTQSVAQGGTLVFGASTGNPISVADVDADPSPAVEQVTLSVSSGTLTLAGTSGLTSVSGNGSSNIVVSGSLLNLNAAFNGLKYQAPNAAGSSTLSVTINDQDTIGLGGPKTATANVTIGIFAVQPVVTLSSSAPSFTQGGSGVVIDGGLTLSDAGSPSLASATVSIGTGFAGVQDVLSFSSASGITSGYNSASGTLTFTGSASLAVYQSLLRSVTYSDSSNDPSTKLRTVSFVVSDGASGSAPVFKAVSVIEVNQAPYFAAFPATALQVVENNNLTFSTANKNAISVADVDSNGGIEQVTLQVSNGTVTLSSVSGLTFVYGTGTNDTSSEFTGTIANLNNALNGLVYSPNPGFANASDTLQVTINDLGNSGNGGALSANGFVTLNVIASNAPAIVPGSGTLNYTDSQGAVAIDPSIQVTDPIFGAEITSATVTISSGLVPTEDDLNFNNTANITGTYSTSTGSLVLTGTDTAADYGAALDSVTYQDISTDPNTQPRTVTFSVTDTQPDTSGTAIRVINVAHANQPPVLTVPGSQTTGLNTALLFSSAANNAFSVSDIDANGGTEQITLTATNGIVTLSSTTGLATATGNGSATVVITGTVPALNSAISSLTFTPNSNFVGNASLQIAANDEGNSGNGGAQSATATVGITVNQLAAFVVQGNVLYVNGNDGINDTFSLSFSSASAFSATLNGMTNSYTIPAISQVIFNGRGGTDSTTLYAANFTSPATILTAPGTLVYKENGFEVDATSSETVDVKGKATDTASMYSATGDIYTFTATPTYATMVGSVTGLVSEVEGAGSVYGVAVNPGDVADLLDSTGTNWFVGTSYYSYMTNVKGGSSYYNEAENFRNVTATGASGTSDVAFLYDSGVQSTFTANQNQNGSTTSTSASMIATGSTPYNNQAINFVNALGFALNTSSVAVLNDTTSPTGNDLISTPAYTTFSTTAFGTTTSTSEFGFDSQAIYFHHVIGTAANATDVGYMYGSTGGGDAFVGNGSHYANGSSDGYASYASLSNSGAFLNEVYNFSLVLAVANGPNDTASLYDDTPGTFFVSNYFDSSPFAAMVGTNSVGTYDNGVLGFKTISIAPISGSSGANDSAALTDSPGNDSLFGLGDNLTLAYPTATIDLNDIAKITATSSNGGMDTKDTRGYDLRAFGTGNWTNVLD